MNLLSDLGNEMAMAILVKKEYSEKIGTKDAVNLIENVQKILRPAPKDEKMKSSFSGNEESKITAH